MFSHNIVFLSTNPKTCYSQCAFIYLLYNFMLFIYLIKLKYCRMLFRQNYLLLFFLYFSSKNFVSTLIYCSICFSHYICV